MTRLSDRYSGIKRLQPPTEHSKPESLYDLVVPHLTWQLVEIDTATSDIMIRRPGESPEQPQLDDLLILVGPVAAAWLRYREEAPR